MVQLVKEVEVFMEILSMIPANGLSDQEKKVILDELKLSLAPMQPYIKSLKQNNPYTQVPNLSVSTSSSTSMVLMIFRFFLQSGEYQFFVKRLKNISVTKLSLLTVNNKVGSNSTAKKENVHPAAKSSYLSPKEFTPSSNGNNTSIRSDSKISNYKAMMDKLKMGHRGSSSALKTPVKE